MIEIHLEKLFKGLFLVGEYKLQSIPNELRRSYLFDSELLRFHVGVFKTTHGVGGGGGMNVNVYASD